MIHINLLEVDSQRVSYRGRARRRRRRTAVACGAAVLLTGAVVAGRVWSVRQGHERLADALALAERELVGLAPIVERLERQEALRRRLVERVGWLEARRTEQAGPVRLLNAVARSLPQGVWLTELRQAPTLVVLEGRAADLTSLSDFVAALERSSTFSPPVEVVGSQIDERGDNGDPVRFELHAVLRGPGSALPAGSG